MQDLMQIVLAAAGGAAVVVAGLGAFLGKVWSDRIIKAQEASSATELADLNSVLDSLRHRRDRVSDAQFALYVGVWNVLHSPASRAPRRCDEQGARWPVRGAS